MRIALAQINPVVGDIAGNARMIRDAIDRAAEQQAELVVLPELALIGYPPRDLLLKPAAIQRCADVIAELAEHCTDIAAIIGYPCAVDPAVGSDSAPGGRSLYNAAAFCHAGRIRQRHDKSLLPTYDVFDEHRYFEPAHDVVTSPFKDEVLGITICEDLWNDPAIFKQPLYKANPAQTLARRGATLLINCSASPFTLGKPAFRHRLFAHTARRFNLPLLHCNQVGGNDELIFDGNSCAFDAQGNLIAQGRAFETDLLIVDLPAAQSLAAQPPAAQLPADVEAASPDRRTPPAAEATRSLYQALVLGLRDYCEKCGFRSIVLGLSGGIDSALTAAIAVGALGSERVRGVAMPSRYSSGHSIDDARELAQRLGIAFDLIPIDEAHRAFEQMLAPVFADTEPDVTEENIQARVRGVILMAMSNKFHALLVTTGNKSELAVGYCTLYGDMAGGLAVLSDVPKTAVWQLARWINEAPDSPLRQTFGRPVIPEGSISKPPSAELRPDQVDQDSLPPYEVLDTIIEHYIEREESIARIVEETGYDTKLVQRIVGMIDRNEYKRKQMPPGLKVTGRAFGVGRRMPIAQRWSG